MTKITFIGAGSLGFTAELVRDILTFPLLEDATIALMDIDAERLDFAKKGGREADRGGQAPGQGERHPRPGRGAQRRRRGADHHPGGQHRCLAARHRDPQEIRRGHQRGRHARPSGIFRFLRTLPPMLDIVRDMEKYCPKAVLLNYTNPMAMLCGALQRQTFIPVTGLCHSVQGTAMMLADWIGAPYRGDRLPVRRHQPPGLVSRIQVERARTPTR